MRVDPNGVVHNDTLDSDSRPESPHVGGGRQQDEHYLFGDTVENVIRDLRSERDDYINKLRIKIKSETDSLFDSLRQGDVESKLQQCLSKHKENLYSLMFLRLTFPLKETTSEVCKLMHCQVRSALNDSIVNASTVERKQLLQELKDDLDAFYAALPGESRNSSTTNTEPSFFMKHWAGMAMGAAGAGVAITATLLLLAWLRPKPKPKVVVIRQLVQAPQPQAPYAIAPINMKQLLQSQQAAAAMPNFGTTQPYVLVVPPNTQN